MPLPRVPRSGLPEGAWQSGGYLPLVRKNERLKGAQFASSARCRSSLQLAGRLPGTWRWLVHAPQLVAAVCRVPSGGWFTRPSWLQQSAGHLPVVGSAAGPSWLAVCRVPSSGWFMRPSWMRQSAGYLPVVGSDAPAAQNFQTSRKPCIYIWLKQI